MLKYFLNDKEISSTEYEEQLFDDGRREHISKKIIMQVINENRREAEENSVSLWITSNGDSCIIKKVEEVAEK